MSTIHLTLKHQGYHLDRSLLIMHTHHALNLYTSEHKNRLKEYIKNELGQAGLQEVLMSNLVHRQLAFTGAECGGIGPNKSSQQNMTKCCAVFFTTFFTLHNLLHNHNPYEKLGAGSSSCCSCLSIAVRCLSSACLPNHCTGNLHSMLG